MKLTEKVVNTAEYIFDSTGTIIKQIHTTEVYKDSEEKEEAN